MVVFNEKPAVRGISEGSHVAVTISPDKEYRHSTNGEIRGEESSGKSGPCGIQLHQPGNYSHTGKCSLTAPERVR
jgi:hypothetical protein